MSSIFTSLEVEVRASSSSSPSPSLGGGEGETAVSVCEITGRKSLYHKNKIRDRIVKVVMQDSKL